MKVGYNSVFDICSFAPMEIDTCVPSSKKNKISNLGFNCEMFISTAILNQTQNINCWTYISKIKKYIKYTIHKKTTNLCKLICMWCILIT